MKLFENIKVLENLKKWLLQAIGFFLVVWLVGVTYASYTAANSWDVLTTSMWNNRNAPDYDSGWVAANSSSSHTDTFTHSFGSLPSNLIVYASYTNDNSWARLVNPNSMGLTYWPTENTVLTSNNIQINYYSWDWFLYCDSNNPCPVWVNSSETWYIRVLARK